MSKSQQFSPFRLTGCAMLLTLTVIGISSCKTGKVNSSTTAVRKNYDINIEAKIVEVDNLGRLYVVDQKNVIVNYKTDLAKAYEYANRRSGTISGLDVTNPLQILAFSDDFNQAYVFDNTLSLIKTISLTEQYADVSACCVSNDGNYWIFDPIQFRLVKINDKGIKILESSNVNDFGLAGATISAIREKGNYVVLCDRKRGFFIFDNMGQYVSRYETTGIMSFQFDGNSIYYTTPTGLKAYDLKSKDRRMLGTPIVEDVNMLKFVLYQPNRHVMVFEQGLNVR
jgi:hypothetical protein